MHKQILRIPHRGHDALYAFIALESGRGNRTRNKTSVDELDCERTVDDCPAGLAHRDLPRPMRHQITVPPVLVEANSLSLPVRQRGVAINVNLD